MRPGPLRRTSRSSVRHRRCAWLWDVPGGVRGRGGALKSSWYGDCLPSRDFPMLIDAYLQGRFDLDGS